MRELRRNLMGASSFGARPCHRPSQRRRGVPAGV